MDANIKINGFNRQVCAWLGKDLTAALKTFADQHGLEITYDGGNFMPNSFSPKIKFSVLVQTANGTVISSAEDNFKKYATVVGLKPEMFGKEFKFKNDKFLITGLSLNRPKFPVDAVKVNTGARFKFHLEGVLSGLTT